MLRFACCLLLFPAIAAAQQSVETTQQPSGTATPRDESVPADSGPLRIVAVEVTKVQISGSVELEKAASISPMAVQRLITEAKESGTFRHMTQIRMSTLNQQQARFQMGATEAVVDGVTTSRGFTRGPDGRPVMATSYRRQETGTIALVTPRVADDGTIVLEVEFEQSRLRRTPPESGETTSSVPPATDITTLNSTVSVPSGQMILAGGFHSAEEDGESLQTLVFVGASTPE
ncbi:MAG: hypothetical protein ACF8PG_09215 [Maioricimonas sp. JB045]|uniref:hypothetical protein n=1 Tax=Maioricimonas sp. JC845 TaxID=3232138 RepID=UPI0034584468